MPIKTLLTSNGACAKILSDEKKERYAVEFVDIQHEILRNRNASDKYGRIICSHQVPTTCRLRFCSDGKNVPLDSSFFSLSDAKLAAATAINQANLRVIYRLYRLIDEDLPELVREEESVLERTIPGAIFERDNEVLPRALMLKLPTELHSGERLPVAITLSSDYYRGITDENYNKRMLSEHAMGDLMAAAESLACQISTRDFN